MIEVTQQHDAFVASYESRKNELAGHDLPWVETLRKEAIDRFAHLGLPTTRHEDWRFTNIKPIAQNRFSPAPAGASVDEKDLARFDFVPGGPRIVLVDGKFRRELSRLDGLPEGVKLGNLAEALRSDAELVEPHLARHAAYTDQAFTALNTASFEDGAFLFVPRGAHIEKPIVVLSVVTEHAEPVAVHPRNLFLLDENCEATLIEVYAATGEGVYLSNPVTEIVLQQNAVMDHYRLQEESEKAFHTATLQVHQERDSNFASQNIVFGSAIARTDINAVLGGEGIESTHNGLTVGRGQQLLDNHTSLDHVKPHCNSYEVYKTILDDSARGVFNGRILVAQDAQKTDAKQTNQNLLLSDRSTINTKPQLEIFADDVRCTHGATIGQLDDEAIFYLRTRGIHEAAARSILTYAFAGYVLEHIKVPSFRNHVEDVLCARLPMGNEVRDAF